MSWISKFLFIFLFYQSSYSEEIVEITDPKRVNFLKNELLQNHSSGINTYKKSCQSHTFQNTIPTKIKIELEDVESWKKNYVKGITSKNKSIPSKFKKKFEATLHIFYEDYECKLDAKIRIHGDLKDHLSHNYTTSLDISLIDGNVLGFTKFKLFLPHTRNTNNEIFINALVKYLDLGITHKTFLLDAEFNGIKQNFLFQSKINKNLLENNLYREGIIIEGDERFMFGGTRFNTIRSDSLSFFRITNENWIEKSNKNIFATTQLLKKLNPIILNYHTQKNFNDYSLFENKFYEMEKNLISSYSEFELLMWLTGSSHGLRPTNRKFYFDSIDQKLIPILYDSDSRILQDDQSYFQRDLDAGLINKFSIQNSSVLKEKIKKIDLSLFNEQLNNSYGLKIDNKKIASALSLILSRIDMISKTHNDNNNLHGFEKYSPIIKTFDRHKDEIKIIFDQFKCSYQENKCKAPQFESCSINLNDCNAIFFNDSEIKDLLSQNLKKNNTHYIYFGDKESFKSKNYLPFQYNNHEFLSIKIQDTEIFYNKDLINIDSNQLLKKITINFLSPYGKVIIKHGKLSHYDIKVINKYNSNVLLDRLDSNLLTGCVTFYNLELDEVSINTDFLDCEDALNFVRVTGSIKKINVIGSKSDAIDFDFSNLIIDSINVDRADNDCIDFSQGNYILNNAILKSCGDKGISAGENSNVNLDNIVILSSLNGIVSKDSTLLEVKNSQIASSQKGFCLAVYRKKQEFLNSFIKANDIKCESRNFYIQEGSILNLNDL